MVQQVLKFAWGWPTPGGPALCPVGKRAGRCSHRAAWVSLQVGVPVSGGAQAEELLGVACVVCGASFAAEMLASMNIGSPTIGMNLLRNFLLRRACLQCTSYF